MITILQHIPTYYYVIVPMGEGLLLIPHVSMYHVSMYRSTVDLAA